MDGNHAKTKFEQKITHRQPAIEAFIKQTMRKAGGDTDFWAQFDDEIDLQFSENDNPDSPNFGQMEYFAYPMKMDPQGFLTTDTSEWVQVFPVDG